MLDIELVSTAGAFAFLLGQPDVLLGNIGEPCDRRKFAARESIRIRTSLLFFRSPVAAFTQPAPVAIPDEINGIITRCL
jgi:hypothetical protein